MEVAMLERNVQIGVIKDIRKELPTSVILKLDSGYMQGIPDLAVFYNCRWGVLEVKRSALEDYQPNQEYYLDLLGKMSFSATIHPSNKKEVIHELVKVLTEPCGCARHSQSQ